MRIESVIPSSHLILCRSLLLPPIPPSIRVISNESTLRMRWLKYWSFSLSISPSNEYLELLSLKIDWSPCCPKDFQESSPAPQFKGINSLVLCLLYGPALPTVHDHHSFDYTDLCQQNAVSVFNILSRFVIAFLPSSNHLRISWLQ